LPKLTTWLSWHNLSTKGLSSAVNLVSINPLEVEMAVELLRPSEAARRLGISTKDPLRLVYERKIRFVMVNGIAHMPDDAVEEYRAKAP